MRELCGARIANTVTEIIAITMMASPISTTSLCRWMTIAVEEKEWTVNEMSDYIDRQAAKLAIVEEGQRSKRYKIGEFWELNRNEAWDAIDSVPSADVEPVRHGRWIVNECSLCGFLTTEWIERCHYCPNCGATMDGEQDE